MSELPTRIKLGGLWENTAKNGQKFLSGDFVFGAQLIMWPNKKRPGTKDPDYTLYLQEKPKKTADTKGAVSDFTAADLAFPSNSPEDIPF